MSTEGLPRRVLMASLCMAAAVSLSLAALRQGSAAASYALGAAVGIGVFAVTVFSGSRLGPPSQEPPRPLPWVRGPAWFMLLLAAKWAAAGTVIWLVTRSPRGRMGWFVAGAAVVQIVLFITAVGRRPAKASRQRGIGTPPI